MVAVAASVSAFDQPAGVKVWDFFAGSAIQSSPAIGPDGMIYFGTDSGKLYSFYPDGRGRWEYPTLGPIVASPAVGRDGTVYAASKDGQIYALSAEGVERWRFQADGEIVSSPAVGANGSVYVGTMRNRFFAIGPDGNKLWDYATEAPVIGSAAVAKDGTVYIPSSDGIVHALDIFGKLKWRFKAPSRIISSPAIGLNGQIYFGCFDGHVYALNAKGKKEWTFATGAPVKGSPAVGPDGIIYIGSDDRQLYALAPDGFKVWTYTTGNWIRSTPAIAEDGTVYIGSYDHSLYALAPGGRKKWEFVTDYLVSSSPAIGTDGTVYFGSWNKRFYAVRGESPLAKIGWARFRGNSRSDGFQNSGEAVPTPVASGTSGPTPSPETVVIAPPKSDATKAASPKAETDAGSGAGAIDDGSSSAKKPGFLSRLWRGITGGSSDKTPASPETVVVAQADSVPLVTVLPGNEIVVTRTNHLDSAQEQAYEEKIAAVQKQLEMLNTELVQSQSERDAAVAKLQREEMKVASAAPPTTARIIADSATLIDTVTVQPPPAPTVTTNVVQSEKELLYQARLRALESQVNQMNSDLAGARESRQSPAVVTVAPPAPLPTVITKSVEPTVPRIVSSSAYGHMSPMFPVRERSEPVAVRPETTVAVGAPGMTTAVASTTHDSRDPAYESRIVALENEVLQLNAELTRAKSRPTMVTPAVEIPAVAPGGSSRVIADSSAIVGYQESPSVPSRAGPVTELEQPGFFGRMWRGVRNTFTGTPKGNTATEVREYPENSAVVSVVTSEPTTVSRPDDRIVISTSPREYKIPESAASSVVRLETVEAIEPQGRTTPMLTTSTGQEQLVSALRNELDSSFGPRFSKIENRLATVNDELASAKLERARMQQQVENLVNNDSARMPVAEVNRSQPMVNPNSVAISDASVPTPVVPNLSQPIVTTAPPLGKRAPRLVTIEQEADLPVEAEKKGFFGRMFGGLKRTFGFGGKEADSAERTTPSVVAVPTPSTSDAAAGIPPIPAFLGGEGNAVATNFPRVAFSDKPDEASMFEPLKPGGSRQPIEVRVPSGTPTVVLPTETRPMKPDGRLSSGRSVKLNAPVSLMPSQPQATLFVYTSGAGRVNPQLHGSTFEIGRTITLQAEPTAGAHFVGWGGSVNVTAPRITFTVMSNMVLQANFRFDGQKEDARPVVTIDSPVAGYSLVNPVMTVTGTARDDQAIARVMVQAGTNEFLVAQGTRNWVFRALAQPGMNMVRVMAVDSSGNESDVVTRSFNYSVALPLQVNVIGQGRVIPSVNGQLHNVGDTYELNAEPAPGSYFVGWSGGLQSGVPLLRFVMKTNLTLTAKFESIPGARAVAQPAVVPPVVAPRVIANTSSAPFSSGRYSGLVFPTDTLIPDKSGFFQLSVSDTGGFEGWLRLAHATAELRGQFNTDGQAQQTLLRPGNQPINLKIQLDPTGQSDVVSGGFSADGVDVVIRGYRASNPGQSPIGVIAGKYTLVIPSPTNTVVSPKGDGFGEVEMDSQGNIHLTGELSDGTIIRQETHISRGGIWPLHVPLYGGKGMLMGWITMTNHAEMDLYGDLRWFKPTTDGDRFYPRGFATRRFVFGSMYRPAPGEIDTRSSLGGVLAGGNLGKIVIGDTAAAVPPTSPEYETISKFTYNINPDTGVVDGRFIHPATLLPVSFRGITVQKRNWSSGYFLGTNQSGVVHLNIRRKQ